MTPIKSAAEVLTWLGVTAPTAQQTLVATTVTNGMMAAFVRELGYNPVQATVTEYLPGNPASGVRDPLIDTVEGFGTTRGRLGTDYKATDADRILQLAVLPVRSVTTVHETAAAWETEGGPSVTQCGGRRADRGRRRPSCPPRTTSSTSRSPA